MGDTDERFGSVEAPSDVGGAMSATPVASRAGMDPIWLEYAQVGHVAATTTG
jgi:hypothetical protein